MLDFLMQTAVIWFIIGFILFLLEFVVPGLILFFFGVGAWIVAIIALFMDLTVNTQLFIFVISSVVSIFLLRDWIKSRIYGGPHSKDLLEDEFSGKTAVALSKISPENNGTIDFKGTTWPASSSDTIEVGEKVTIIGNDSIILIVQTTKTL